MRDLELTIGFLMAIERGDLSLLPKLLSETLIFRGSTLRPLNKREIITLITAVRAGIPNWRSHFRDVRIDGKVIRMTIEVTGTHLRPLPGIFPGMPDHPPTGRAFHLPPETINFLISGDTIEQISIDPVKGGGFIGMLEQLGIPVPIPN